jgi:hypothetical protein
MASLGCVQFLLFTFTLDYGVRSGQSVRLRRQKPEGIQVMERTFKASWIQDTGLIAATLLNERGLKSTVERKVTCPDRRLLVQVESHPLEISKHYSVFEY